MWRGGVTAAEALFILWSFARVVEERATPKSFSLKAELDKM